MTYISEPKWAKEAISVCRSLRHPTRPHRHDDLHGRHSTPRRRGSRRWCKEGDVICFPTNWPTIEASRSSRMVARGRNGVYFIAANHWA